MIYVNKAERKEQMLETMLDIYVRNGLENTSMRNIASALEIGVSSLYAYFDSKENIVIETAKYYMGQLENTFKDEFEHLSPDLKAEIDMIYTLLVREKERIRFIYQVVSSPLYGERGRRELEKIYTKYFKFSDSFAKFYNISKDGFEEVFMLFIATIHDFCIWDNEKYANKKLKYIYHLIDKELKK